MNYQFPVITHLQQALEAIAGRDEFIVAEKDGYTVINYVMASNETFPPVTDEKTAILRECRGLVFENRNGTVVSRRFQKFFNLGEKDETFLENIDFSKPHHILEKLDGSMITPFMVGGQILWGTKMGLTDVAAPVEDFIQTHKEYKSFAGSVLKTGKTPIFEWTSRKQRIVLDYPEDSLVLLAIRDNVTGAYVPWYSMKKMADLALIPVVRKFNPETDMRAFIQNVKLHPGGVEGVVIRFEDGHMVKVKTDWYVRLHKTKAMIKSERDVANIILNSAMDDLVTILQDEDRKRVESYRTRLLVRCHQLGVNLQKEMKRYTKKTRKEFALGPATKMDPLWKSMIFSLWEEEATIAVCLKTVYDVIIRHTNNNRSWGQVKEWLLKGTDYA